MKNRQSIRLRNYDYAANGAYFVTICTHNRECSLGEIVNGEMVVNELGRLVSTTWMDLPNHNDNIQLDEFVIMPNHIHGIIIIVGAGSKPAQNRQIIFRAGLEPAPTTNANIKLSEIVRQLKTFSARRINQLRNTPRVPVWQRNYYEHIIRNKKSLNQIRDYIQNNPLQWQWDENNPDNNKGIMLNVQTR